MTDETYPYTNVPGALEEFLGKLRAVGLPQRIDRKYLEQLGYKSSNHHRFVPIMKQAGLLDENGAPTDAYKKGLRGGTGGRTLVAEAIREGYSSLFETYPDAPATDKATLATFIGANSSLGAQAVSAAVSTFLTLCRFGDFESVPAAPSVEAPGESAAGMQGNQPADTGNNYSSGGGQGGNVTINVNIALSVDATSDPAVYDAFFAAMAKHIKVLDGRAPNSA